MEPPGKRCEYKKKTMLSESAFECTEEKPNSVMTELVLPGDSTIKDSAFSNYSKLNKVTIKKGAKLGTKILPGCSALETFIFEADTPQNFESLTFTNFEPENITIYVLDVEKYKEALKKDTGSDLDEHYNIEFVDRLKKLHIHNLTLVPAKDATCTEEGNKAYYICDGCDKWFEDAEGKSEITDKTSVIIPAADHTLSDWKADDNSHWHECECGYKADVAQHSFKWVIDKEANATQKGAKHEECTVCGYKRAAVEIPATGSTVAPTTTPATTPKKDSTTTTSASAAKNPKTGDNSNIFLWIVLLLISGGSVIILCKHLRLMIKFFFQRAFSIYADIRKLQDKVQISYTLSTLKNLLPSTNYTSYCYFQQRVNGKTYY